MQSFWGLDAKKPPTRLVVMGFWNVGKYVTMAMKSTRTFARVNVRKLFVVMESSSHSMAKSVIDTRLKEFRVALRADSLRVVMVFSM